MTMAEYTFPKQSNYGWGLTFNMTGKAPIVNKRIFATLADAQAFVDDVDDSAIEGLILSVIADGDNNGAYFVENIHDDEHSTGTLKKIGGDSSTDITNLQSDVTALQSDVTALQSDVAELQNIDHSAFIKGIKVNGEEITPVDQVVDITIDTPTYDSTISEDNKESTNAPQTKAVYDFVNGIKTDLETKISTVETFKFEVVDSLDSIPEISTKTIYLVKKENNEQESQNVYTEYIWVNNKWEILGELKFDPTELEGKVTDLETTLNGNGTEENPGLIKKVDNIETALNGKISGLEERLTERLITAESNITTNTNDIAAIKGRLDTVETNIDGLTTKIDGDGTEENPGLITNVTNLTTEVTNIKGKIDDITSTGGEPNTIETIQINGVSITPVDKTVNIGVKLNGVSITPADKTVNISAVTSVVAKDFASAEKDVTITDGKLVIESLTSTDIDTAITLEQA